MLHRATDAGIERILVPGWDVRSSEAALDLASRHAPLIQAAVGVHPHYVAQMSQPDWAHLERLARDERCSAIGEIGLDFFRNLSPRPVQREAFARQLALANDRRLPVIVHDREAHREITDSLVAWPGQPRTVARGVLHAFSGYAHMARLLADVGYVVSFALPLRFRSAAGPREAAPMLADGEYLVETDAPYLGPDRDGRNEPLTALRVAAELAKLRGSTPAEVARAVRRSYEALTAATRAT